MTGKHTTIGDGVRRETSDPTVVAKTLAARDGHEDAVRVEDLSALEHLRLKEDEAGQRIDEADAALRVADAAYAKALCDWSVARRARIAEENRLKEEAK